MLKMQSVGSCGHLETYENVEKYVMQIGDKFPADVIAEATYLVENSTYWKTWMRESDRLATFRAYAIDREGAAEVDDGKHRIS